MVQENFSFRNNITIIKIVQLIIVIAEQNEELNICSLKSHNFENVDKKKILHNNTQYKIIQELLLSIFSKKSTILEFQLNTYFL